MSVFLGGLLICFFFGLKPFIQSYFNTHFVLLLRVFFGSYTASFLSSFYSHRSDRLVNFIFRFFAHRFQACSAGVLASSIFFPFSFFLILVSPFQPPTPPALALKYYHWFVVFTGWTQSEGEKKTKILSNEVEVRKRKRPDQTTSGQLLKNSPLLYMGTFTQWNLSVFGRQRGRRRNRRTVNAKKI